MFGKQLDAKQRLDKAIVDIMANPKYVALAGVLMIGDRAVRDDVPTACTNGRDEYYGRAFVDSINDAELRFVVLHECYHKLYRHLTTWRHLFDKNPGKANAATDYVINIKLVDDNADGFAKMPAKALVDEKYRGMGSAQVFNLLPDDDGKGGGSGGGIDDHDWDGAQEMDGEEVKQLARDIDQAVRQGALLAGKTGSGGDRSLQELLQPKVDWREALREFISSTCTGNDFSTWRRPNRRFVSMGYYMPSGISEQVGTLVIGIDTSVSIGGRELSRFLGEVKGICDTAKPECIRLLYWDTKVCRDEKYVGDGVQNLTSSTKPAGGGGTSVRCVYEYLQKHAVKAQAVVMLTDGYVGSDWGTAQQWGAPVLWCIVGNNGAQPTVGKRVLVDD